MSESSVPSRAEWFGEYKARNKIVKVEVHNAFGWKVHRHLMPAGSVLVTHAAAEVARVNAPNRAMYVRGVATVVCEDGKAMDERVPGLYTHERGPHPAGTTTITAVEDVEFFCFNYTANRKSLPKLTPVRLAVGDTFELKPGAKLFAMSGQAGEIVGPSCFTSNEATKLTATTYFYAFIVGEEKS